MNPLGEHLPEVEIKSLETTQKENSIGKIVSTPGRRQSTAHLTIDAQILKGCETVLHSKFVKEMPETSA